MRLTKIGSLYTVLVTSASMHQFNRDHQTYLPEQSIAFSFSDEFRLVNILTTAGRTYQPQGLEALANYALSFAFEHAMECA